MLELELATQFKRDLKKITKQGKSRKCHFQKSYAQIAGVDFTDRFLYSYNFLNYKN